MYYRYTADHTCKVYSSCNPSLSIITNDCKICYAGSHLAAMKLIQNNICWSSSISYKRLIFKQLITRTYSSVPILFLIITLLKNKHQLKQID